MNKIRVVHHSKTVGYSGTDRTAQLFAKYLSRSDKFEPFIVYREGDSANTRLDVVKEWLGEDHVISYEWVPGKKGRQPPYLPEKDNLFDVLQSIKPDIIHLHRSGYPEWPGFTYLAPNAKWFETNIFGYVDHTLNERPFKHIYISEYIRNKALKAGSPDGPVLYNPVEEPAVDMTPENKQKARNTLLSNFKLPSNAILLGRVGRADNFDPISLRAMEVVLKNNPNVYYIVVNGCDAWRQTAKQLGIEENIIYSGPIISDFELSSFYLGLDIYAHARHDGECCPCNIQEAMMHGIPVVSHESGIYNGQSEIIGDSGFVVPIGDYQAYAVVLLELINNSEIAIEDERNNVRIRDYFGRLARRRAMRYFHAEYITKQLEKIYDKS